MSTVKTLRVSESLSQEGVKRVTVSRGSQEGDKRL